MHRWGDPQHGTSTRPYLHSSRTYKRSLRGRLSSPLEQAAMDLEEEWSQNHITDPKENPVDSLQSSILTPSWELDPPPLMANHPPRITDSNTRITLQEGSLREPCPRNENGIGWVQIQQKSLRWEEQIQGSSIITHEGLTTLDHPNRGREDPHLHPNETYPSGNKADLEY